MQRITLSDSLSMSQIVYGMWRLGDDADTSVAHVTRKVESCLAQGITTLDQADIYGGYEAEAILGAALKANPALRDQVEIVTKCDIVAPVGRHADVRIKHYDTSRAYLESAVDSSLKCMNIEHIDLLLIHRPDPMMDHHETGAALDAIVASGKVGNIGVSNFRPWDWELLQSGMSTPLVTNQIELSIQAHEGFVNGDVAFHQRHGHSMMAWSPLAGGSLLSADHPVNVTLLEVAERYEADPAAVAVAWLLAHPATIIPVLGTNNLQRIAQLSEAVTIDMDRQTWFELYSAGLGREVA